MTAAFIVQLNTGSDTDLIGIAEDIKEACEQDGMAVISCKPWARPSQQVSGVLPSTPSVAPTNTTTQLET